MPKSHPPETRRTRAVTSREDERTDSGNGSDVLHCPSAKQNKDLAVNYRGHRKSQSALGSKTDEPLPVLLEVHTRCKVHAYILHEEDDQDDASGGADASLEHLCKLKEIPDHNGVQHPHRYRYGAMEVSDLLEAEGAPFRLAFLVEGTGAPNLNKKELDGASSSMRLFTRHGSGRILSGRRSSQKLTVSNLFDVLDADKDGTLTRAEVMFSLVKFYFATKCDSQAAAYYTWPIYNRKFPLVSRW